LNYYKFIVYPLVSTSPHIFGSEILSVCSRYPGLKFKWKMMPFSCGIKLIVHKYIHIFSGPRPLVKEGYGGGGGLRRGLSFYGIFFLGGGSLGFAERRVEFWSWRISTGAPVCWRFWARGPGYPYDILELGSCPSWQGGTRFWAVFTQFSNGQQGKRKMEG
jgi:hypothetical protein